MKFGWINIFGAATVAVMMIPNIVYAIKNKDEKNLCTNKFMNIIEQIGRYACVVLMWLPLLVWEFGFAGVFPMVVYVAGNAALLTAYVVLFSVYMKKRSASLAIALAIIPSVIFLLSGLTLRHWLLVGFAAVFAVGHIYVTAKNQDGTNRCSK